jgi:ribose transport system ATP-binding protein
MTDSPAPPLLEVRNIRKRFPGVLALDGVSMTLRRGEALAVIGENGAGKSTLMKILAGVQTPDAGDILIDGQPVAIDSVRTATALGVALIHQELNLSDNLDVGANVYLGREPRVGGPLGLIDRKRIDRGTRDVLQRIGLTIPPRTIVSTLPIGQQQMIEIAKALSINARVLIMDEPTSSLSSRETEQLFRVVRDLKATGVSIVYISHRLGEVKLVADRVTVLRDGRNAGNLELDQISHDRMVKLMVGRDVSQFYHREPHTPGDAVLEVHDLRVPGRTQHPISLSVRSGEIVGVAGLVGAGRTEMLRAIFGIDRAPGGTVRVAGNAVELNSPRDAIAAGMALVPEDRKLQGLIIEMAVRENISLAGLRRWQHAGFRDAAKEKAVARDMIDKLNIKTPSPLQIAQYLSGGNQQKVVLAKWLALQPRVLILDEPTRGIDVGAKEEIYRLMDELAARGVATLFVSSEMEEILGMSDRVLVMHEGRIAGELQRGELSEEAVMHLATGRTLAA